MSKITVNNLSELRAFIGRQTRARRRKSFVKRFGITPEYLEEVNRGVS